MSIQHALLKPQAVSTFFNQGSRPGQEDHLLVDKERGIFVIADGFGGPAPGAEAAQVACEEIKNYLFKEAGDSDATMPFVLRTYFTLAGNVLFNSLIYANNKLTQLNKNRGIYLKGGASVLACYVDGDLLAVANVGNCSLWLVRNGELRPLTMPRSYGQYFDPFLVKNNQDADYPQVYSVPLMALGISADLEPEICEFRLRKGDWIVLNTDGVSTEFPAKLAELQKKGASSEESAQGAMKMLNEGSYRDNAAAALVFF